MMKKSIAVVLALFIAFVFAGMAVAQTAMSVKPETKKEEANKTTPVKTEPQNKEEM